MQAWPLNEQKASPEMQEWGLDLGGGPDPYLHTPLQALPTCRLPDITKMLSEPSELLGDHCGALQKC